MLHNIKRIASVLGVILLLINVAGFASSGVSGLTPSPSFFSGTIPTPEENAQPEQE